MTMGKSDVCIIQNGPDTMGHKYKKPNDAGTQKKTGWVGGAGYSKMDLGK